MGGGMFSVPAVPATPAAPAAGGIQLKNGAKKK
jgi:hypothetical protein